MIEQDNGPWRANTSEDGSVVFIDSDDFEHDVQLLVHGDFESQLSKYLYARNLAERMNQMPAISKREVEQVVDALHTWAASELAKKE